MGHQLGGEGKVVEIDEAFIKKKKTGQGPYPCRAEKIVFGMTEHDGGSVLFEDLDPSFHGEGPEGRDTDPDHPEVRQTRINHLLRQMERLLWA